MGIITRMRKQKAVYWALGSADSGGMDFNDYGQPLYAEPIELTVRWEDTSVEFLDNAGAKILSNSVVYVGEDVVLGGILMLGELIDINSGGEPKENDNAWEIKRFEKLPNIRNTEFLRTVFL